LAISAKKLLLPIGLMAISMLISAPAQAKNSMPAAPAKPSAPAPASAGGQGSPGYRVEATSNYAGTLSCQMCKDGIRVKSDRMGLTWILTAPKWNAQIYNTSTECYMDLPYGEWTTRQSFMPMNKKKAKLKLQKTDNTKTMHGMQTRQYVIMATFEPGSQGYSQAMASPGQPGIPGPASAGKQKTTPKSAKPDKSKETQGVTVREAEMWIAKDPCVPKQFNELMSKIFGIPAEDGLPLSISLRQKNGKITSIWETVKLTKGNIGRDEFKPIQGFKKVKTEVEMMLGDQDLGMDDSSLDFKQLKRKKMDDMP